MNQVNKVQHMARRIGEALGGRAPYPQVPLEVEEFKAAAVQMNPVPIDEDDPAKGIQANVDRMLQFCDAAATWPVDPYGLLRLIVFPEFSINGFDTKWTRKDWLNICIRLPGPETERIGQKAKELGCYIAFANYCQDADWPGHFSNTSVIIGPDGDIIHRHWKAYIGFPGMVEYGATVHDVLDQFLERYGWEGVWPVAKTPIGNIGTYVCSEGFIPETARALALNGAEILVRHTANGGSRFGIEFPGIGNALRGFQAHCSANGTYGVYANSTGSSIRMNGRPMLGNTQGGASVIVNPYGDIIAHAGDSNEEVVQTVIPIAAHRKRHAIPALRPELYAPVYANIRSPFPPNLYADYLPKDEDDALEWSLKQAKSRLGR